MSNAPTQYYLIFRNPENGCETYDVYETHRCQEKGCLWTTEEYTGETCSAGSEAKFVEEYNRNLIEGYVCGYEVQGYIEVRR